MKTIWPAPPSDLVLSHNAAHVWLVRLDQMAAQEKSLAAILSPDEQQRAQQFRLDAPRKRFVLARAALRILLGRYLQIAPHEVRLTVDADNKPRLAVDPSGDELQFNVAHSENVALIAVISGCEIGVDVERLRSVRHAAHIAERFFHPLEIEAVLAAPAAGRDAVFMRCWTGKEAVLKAIGTGIVGSLAGFSVLTDDASESENLIDVPMSKTGQSTQCWVRRLEVDSDYTAAVSVVGPGVSVRCMTFVP